MISISMSALALFPGPVSARGRIIILSGRVVDVNGDPIREARVEIWQTDAFGVYNHPGDSHTEKRDRGFQFYGNSAVDDDGEYLFRTVLPGKYEPRPMHIHVKVWQRRKEILTTQFYFAVDNRDFGTAPADLRLLLEDGGPYDSDYTARFDLVVDVAGARNNPKLTRSQAEGPYYPVVEVSRYDNDLAHVD
jgi:protocatechuate 3,4-dioxygenase beta subunit